MQGGGAHGAFEGPSSQSAGFKMEENSKAEPRTLTNQKRDGLSTVGDSSSSADRRLLRIPAETGGNSQSRFRELMKFNKRQGDPRRVVSRAELAKHCSRESCWVALEGAVFDVTYYLHFHPGGERVLLREAGRDATAAFRRHHPWVNFRHILEHCQVGVLGTEEAEVDEAVVAAAGPSFSSPTAAGARGGEALTPTAVIALPLPPAIPEEGEDAEAEAAITPSFGTAPSLC